MKTLFVNILTLPILFQLNLHAQTDSVYYGNKDKSKQRKESLNSQRNKLKEKIFYGGNFAAWIGNPTFVNLSPLMGYKFTERFHGGIGVIYNYTSIRYSSGRNFSQSIYGGHSFLRFFVNETIFLQAQYDKLNQPDYFSANRNNRIWIDYTLVGGGYRSGFGNVAFVAAILYNITPHRLSVYSNPYVQIGFIGGF